MNAANNSRQGFGGCYRCVEIHSGSSIAIPS